MAKRLKTIAKFASEAAERVFWEKTDSTAYVEWKKAARPWPSRSPNNSDAACQCDPNPVTS